MNKTELTNLNLIRGEYCSHALALTNGGVGCTVCGYMLKPDEPVILLQATRAYLARTTPQEILADLKANTEADLKSDTELDRE